MYAYHHHNTKTYPPHNSNHILFNYHNTKNKIKCTRTTTTLQHVYYNNKNHVLIPNPQFKYMYSDQHHNTKTCNQTNTKYKNMYPYQYHNKKTCTRTNTTVQIMYSYHYYHNKTTCTHTNTTMKKHVLVPLSTSLSVLDYTVAVSFWYIFNCGCCNLYCCCFKFSYGVVVCMREFCNVC
jgi:hypothetical protein